MLQSLFRQSGYLLLEIISFFLMLPVLLLSCIVLLATGKFRAFVLGRRETGDGRRETGDGRQETGKWEDEKAEVVMEGGR
jgi:hypothetical protein